MQRLLSDMSGEHSAAAALAPLTGGSAGGGVASAELALASQQQLARLWQGLAQAFADHGTLADGAFAAEQALKVSGSLCCPLQPVH